MIEDDGVIYKKFYWWSKVTRNVGKYMNRYDICQQIKNRTEVSVEKLKLSEVSEKLWTHLTIDFITKLLLVVRKDAILVVYTHFIATTEETLVEELVWLFRDNIWKLYELLKSMISDRGP